MRNDQTELELAQLELKIKELNGKLSWRPKN